MTNSTLARPNRSDNSIYLNGKPIGRVVGSIFLKSITGSRHMLRRPPAIAFDASSLDEAERKGATEAAITDVETGRTYRADFATIRNSGFTFNRGYGLQIALPLSRWRVVGPNEPPAAQLGLFDMRGAA